jgi:formylglycine-generating enzyme required for sulfatase activity/predicted ATPase
MVFSKVADKAPLKPGVKEATEQANTFSNQILILFSAPLLTEQFLPVENLSIQKEIDAIAQVLEEIPQPLSLEIVVKAATSETLQDVLATSTKPLMIHFIGHGMTEGERTALVLEDKTGIARPFSEEELKIALSHHKQAPCQLALLNACHSQKLAQAFVRAQTPHVIAVNAEDTILNQAARCFSRRLYQALFNQDSVGNSFLSARNAVKLDDDLKKEFNAKSFQQGVNLDEAFKFQLLPQDSHDQSLRIEPADTHQINYPQWLKTNIPRDNPNFIGRREEIHRVIKELVESNQRCIALHGMGGIGKTVLAEAIGRWLHERDRFRDGVWLISLRDVNSVETLIAEIVQNLELTSYSLTRELKDSRIFLILDDLDGLIRDDGDHLIELLNSLLRQCPHLNLLLTSRDSLVREIPDYCHQEEVGSMGASATRQIFRNYAPRPSEWGNDDLEEDFQRLIQFLDGYPIAIKLAASYMKENQSTLRMLCEDLDIEPLEILDSYSAQEKRERSLRITLELSFQRLSVEGQDLFPLLAFFPSGLSRNLVTAVWGRSTNKALLELFKFSMAERPPTASDWRLRLPEPARAYAETKLQQGRGIDDIAPQVLDFYCNNFSARVLQLVEKGEPKKGQQLLINENANLISFLQWGYEKEQSPDGICRSARITASLSTYWRSLESDQEILERLQTALVTAQRNQDQEGEELVRNAINAFELKSNEFAFEVITVNKRGKVINRETKKAEYYREDLGNDVVLEMVAIPGGTFQMGSPQGEGFDNEKPQHKVSIEPFFMGKYPITQAQWHAIMSRTDLTDLRVINLNPAYFKDFSDSEHRPVERVNWYQAKEFCARLSKLTGQYYRLPSEAEWEYACRAGTQTPFHFGETLTDQVANYRASEIYANEPKGEFRQQTTPVGSFLPNPFGLYDLHGNVWEWCGDNWEENYNTDRTQEYYEGNEKHKLKLIRGGSLFTPPDHCRSASRFFNNPDEFTDTGFRVMSPRPPDSKIYIKTKGMKIIKSTLRDS